MTVNPNPGLGRVGPRDVDLGLAHNLMETLSNIANASAPGTFGDEGQEGFAAWAANCARLAPYGDWCQTCAKGPDLVGDPTRYPVGSVPTREGFIRCAYACYVCQAKWTCGWAVSGPWDLG